MRKSIFSFVSLLLVSAGLLLVIIFNTTPISPDPLIRVAFFGALFLCLFSFLVASNYFYRRFGKKPIDKDIARVILRRCALISFFMVGVLILNVFNVLNLISGITFFVALVLLEIFFINRRIEKTDEK